MSRFSPREIFGDYFSELDRQQIPYVILHGYETYPDRIASDVDVCVADNALAAARRLQWETASRCGWAVAQVVQHQFCAYHTVLVDRREPATWLKLDLCSHWVRDNSFFLRADTLLEGRRAHRGFFVPRPAAECLYLLTKTLTKQKPTAAQMPRLQALFDAEPAEAEQLFAMVFGQSAGKLADWFNQPSAAWDSLRTTLQQRTRFNWRQRWLEIRRRANRIRRPVGLRLAILGPDGAGKSLVIGNLETHLAPFFRAQLRIHFAPMLFRAQTGAIVTQPHAIPPRSVLVSWIKVFYHFVDHLLGYFFQQLPAQIRCQCIIFDRNFDDLLIDPRRYRIQCSAGLVDWLRRRLPRPDVTVVLDAPAELIHARKPELPVAELDRQRHRLIELAATDRRYVVVSAADPGATVARNVCLVVTDRLIARESGRRRDGAK